MKKRVPRETRITASIKQSQKVLDGFTTPQPRVIPLIPPNIPPPPNTAPISKVQEFIDGPKDKTKPGYDFPKKISLVISSEKPWVHEVFFFACGGFFLGFCLAIAVLTK